MEPIWRRVFLALGANQEPRVANCLSGLKALGRHPGVRLRRCSHFYETEPVGMESPCWFVNAVAEIETRLAPAGLLAVLLDIERLAGRDRSSGMDRPLDLDILYDDNQVIREPGLEIPHPRLVGRRFVLEPWAELAPDLRLSPWGRTVAELLASLPLEGPHVIRIGESPPPGGLS